MVEKIKAGNAIGRKIKRLRQKMGLSQGEVARQLTISIPAFSKIETGMTDLSTARMKQIATFFGVTPVYFLADEAELETENMKKEEMLNKISELQSQVAGLQKKLIASYEQNEELKKMQK